MADPIKYVVKSEVKQAEQKVEFLLNAAGKVKANETTVPVIRAACGGILPKYVAFAETANPGEMQFVPVRKGASGAVKVRFYGRQTTMTFSFDPILTIHESLAVDPGYVRHLSCRLEPPPGPHDGASRFIITLTDTAVEPATDAFGRRQPKQKKTDGSQNDLATK